MPSRRWPTATNSSRREKTSLTGRRAARASAATWPSKWKSHLAPKPPPSSGTIDAHVRLGDLERVGDAAARRVRHLGRRPDGHLVALPLRDDRARLDRDALHRVGHVAALDDDVGAGERRVDVALDDRRVAERVAVAAERSSRLVRLPVGMDERGVVGERRLEVGHDGQRLVVDLDQRRRLLGDLGGRRRDAGDDVALEAHRVPSRTAAGP